MVEVSWDSWASLVQLFDEIVGLQSLRRFAPKKGKTEQPLGVGFFIS